MNNKLIIIIFLLQKNHSIKFIRREGISMNVLRQDGWSEDEDLVLAEVILKHIRDGSTQLAAFDEVAAKLGRTAAACGFRWNSTIRHKYTAAIQIAKEHKKNLIKQREQNILQTDDAKMKVIKPQNNSTIPIVSDNDSENEIDFEDIIKQLKQYKISYNLLQKKVSSLEKELSIKEEQLITLKKENERLQEELKMKNNINDDYKTLLQIIDRARKMAVLSDDNLNNMNRPKFRMDSNGNLERVE